MYGKVRAICPLPTSPLSLRAGTLGEKVLLRIQPLCVLRQITGANQRMREASKTVLWVFIFPTPFLFFGNSLVMFPKFHLFNI